MFSISNGCLVSCQCYGGSDQHDIRKFNFKECRRCLTLFKREIQSLCWLNQINLLNSSGGCLLISVQKIKTIFNRMVSTTELESTWAVILEQLFALSSLIIVE